MANQQTWSADELKKQEREFYYSYCDMDDRATQTLRTIVAKLRRQVVSLEEQIEERETLRNITDHHWDYYGEFTTFGSRYSVSQIVEVIGIEALSFGQIVAKAKYALGMSKATVDRLLKQGQEAGAIEKINLFYRAVSRLSRP